MGCKKSGLIILTKSYLCTTKAPACRRLRQTKQARPRQVPSNRSSTIRIYADLRTNTPIRGSLANISLAPKRITMEFRSFGLPELKICAHPLAPLKYSVVEDFHLVYSFATPPYLSKHLPLLTLTHPPTIRSRTHALPVQFSPSSQPSAI